MEPETQALMNSRFFQGSRFHWDFMANFEEPDSWRRLADTYSAWLRHGTETNREIPRKIHQIWIGGKCPRKYSAWRRSWMTLNPGYEYRLWTEESLLELGLKNEKAFSSARNPALKSDIARYEILHRFGGIYADTDFECLASFEPLFHKSSFLVGLVFGSSPIVNNALIMSQPGHSILADLIEKIGQEDPEVFARADKAEEIFHLSGPHALTQSVLEYLPTSDPSFAVLPSNFFYPWPNFVLDSTSDRYSFLTSDSLAIHHWQVSWAKRSKLARAAYAAYLILRR